MSSASDRVLARLESLPERERAQAEADIEAAARDAARSSMLSFMKYTRPFYRASWHHRRICRAIDDVLAGKIDRLMIEAPPRSGKTEIVSRGLPAKKLGMDPDSSVISTSYGADLASANNRDVQRIMEGREYGELYPASRLGDENIRTVSGSWLRNSDEFEIVGHRGSYRCAGVGGGITGRGGNLIIVDDPIKNQEEAYSLTQREKVWGWYTSTVYTRLQGLNAAIVLIMTRWHPDDLAGRLLQLAAADPDADQWVRLSFPALKEGPPTEDDPRNDGEPLWPEQHDVKKLKRIRASTSPTVWSALYQQRPSAREGTMVKGWWLRFYYRRTTPPRPHVVVGPDEQPFECPQEPLPKRMARVITSWDLPFKSKNRKTGDSSALSNVAGHVWGELGANVYLLDRAFGKMNYPETKTAFRDVAADWEEAAAHIIEDKANGSPLLDDLANEIPAMVPFDPAEYGDKELRLDLCLPRFVAGNIWLPHPVEAPWVLEVVAALLNFPAHTQKDDVDALTQAVLWLKKERSPEELLAALGRA